MSDEAAAICEDALGTADIELRQSTMLVPAEGDNFTVESLSLHAVAELIRRIRAQQGE